MIIPRFWSSAKQKHKDKQGQMTIQRWGWSSVSQDEANRHAQFRLEQAMEEALKVWPKRPTRTHEQKLAYNGAEGLPIREEIIEEYSEGIITRNSYGALCLNVPSTLILDLDEDDFLAVPKTWKKALWLGVLVLATLITWVVRANVEQFPQGIFPGANVICFVVAFVMSKIVVFSMHNVLRNLWLKSQGGVVGWAKKRMEKAIQLEPGYWIVYKTPAGARVIGAHCAFDPQSPETQKWMNFFKVDPLYQKMCHRQNCFRARVSGKPWRIPNGPQRWRSGVWPLSEDQQLKRKEWVKAYEAVAKNHAACRLVAVSQNCPIALDQRQVIDIHDTHSQSKTTKPLA